MSWFADLAGKAESLLNNLDEQTGAALRNHNVKKSRNGIDYQIHPEGNWNQRKRNIIKNLKKPPVNDVKSVYSPSRKLSPTNQVRMKEGPDQNGARLRKSPVKKSTQFHLEHCPKTLVGDVHGDTELMDHLGFNRRRYNSLPTELDLISAEDDWNIHMQNLEVENAMLKNEINVTNREVSEFMNKLRALEDGNNVDRSSTELSQNRTKLENSEMQNHKASLEKESMACQLDMLKQRISEINTLKQNYQEEKQVLVSDYAVLRESNNVLEERIKELTKRIEDTSTSHLKLENELRQKQTTISELQSDLQKSNNECQRLEKDWETYKLRVKSMLHAKDNEIKALQDGLNFSEDTKVLVEQLDSLKEERDELSEVITTVRSECDSLKQYLSQLESAHVTKDRVVNALRDTVRDERGARTRAEQHVLAISQELKNMQTETGQTIASLRTALRDKENEIINLKDTASSIKSTDTSAINVADYDVSRDTMDQEKIQYLTETLVQRQGRVDKLLAENNMLRIQMDKLESKYKESRSHSIVNVQETRARRVHSDSLMTSMSNRIGAVLRRNPALRLFVIGYMICLHFWVVTVLLSSTPTENVPSRPSRS